MSKKSGLLYERRLIEQYVDDNGKVRKTARVTVLIAQDPVTGEELALDDLLPLKSCECLRLCMRR